MSDTDPIHNHPTVQRLLTSHRRIVIVAFVVGLVCLGLVVRLSYDDTIGYARPALLQ